MEIQFNGCREISLKNTNVSLTVALQVMKRCLITKVIRVQCLGIENVQNFVPGHQADFEMFHWLSKSFDLLMALRESWGIKHLLYLTSLH